MILKVSHLRVLEIRREAELCQNVVFAGEKNEDCIRLWSPIKQQELCMGKLRKKRRKNLERGPMW